MRTGHGRGYYGVGQLAQEAPRRKNWFTIVAVIGVGATVAWFLWPRSKAVPDFGFVCKDPERTFSPPSMPGFGATPGGSTLAQVQGPSGQFSNQLEAAARSAGFHTVKDYEDSVIKSIKQLQDSGAKVVLAPYLEHLAPKPEPVVETLSIARVP